MLWGKGENLPTRESIFETPCTKQQEDVWKIAPFVIIYKGTNESQNYLSKLDFGKQTSAFK